MPAKIKKSKRAERKDSFDDQDLLPTPADDDTTSPDDDDMEEDYDAPATPAKPKKDGDAVDDEDADDFTELKDSDTEIEPAVEIIDDIVYDDEEIEPPVHEIIKTITVVAPDERRTSERLSIFECGAMIGNRSRHINNGATPLVDASAMTSSLEIAYHELIQKKIPMSTVRTVGKKRVEIWRLSEMVVPKLGPPEEFMI